MLQGRSKKKCNIQGGGGGGANFGAYTDSSFPSNVSKTYM